MKSVYLICKMITNLAFIGISVFLAVYTKNYHFLWLLTIPVLSHFNEDYSDSQDDIAKQKLAELDSVLTDTKVNKK